MLCRLFHIRPLPYLYTGNRHAGILFINDESQRVSTGPQRIYFQFIRDPDNHSFILPVGNEPVPDLQSVFFFRFPVKDE